MNPIWWLFWLLLAGAPVWAYAVDAPTSCHCSCDPPGVWRSCDFDCNALCGGGGGRSAVSKGGGESYQQQLMMRASSALLQGLLTSIFSDDSAAQNQNLAQENQRLAQENQRLAQERLQLVQEEAKRRAEQDNIAEKKRQVLIGELKGFHRVELGFKGQPRALGFKADDYQELKKAAALCLHQAAGLSDQAFDLALNGDYGLAGPSASLSAAPVTESQAKAFAEIRGACRQAARDDGIARQNLEAAEDGLNAMKHAVHYAKGQYDALKQEPGAAADQVAKAAQTLKDARAYELKVAQAVPSARAKAAQAQKHLAEAQAAQHRFACDHLSL